MRCWIRASSKTGFKNLIFCSLAVLRAALNRDSRQDAAPTQFFIRLDKDISVGVIEKIVGVASSHDVYAPLSERLAPCQPTKSKAFETSLVILNL
jgi:hypothetical protein